MRVKMHKRRFHERAIRRVEGEPHELAWHRRWPPELQLTAATWLPGAQHPYRISWDHAGFTFWAAHGPADADGSAIVVHGHGLETEFAHRRHRFVVINRELTARGLSTKDAQFPVAAVCFASRWWVLMQRTPDPDDGRGRAVAIHQEVYRPLNYRLVVQATRDIVELARSRGRVHMVPEGPGGNAVPYHQRQPIDRNIIDIIVNASHARARFHRDAED